MDGPRRSQAAREALSAEKSGFRFSANAAMPSRWCGVPNSDRNIARSARTPSVSVVSNATLTARLAMAAATGDCAAILAADLSAVVDQLGRRDDLADQAAALGLGRVHHPAGQAEIHRLGLADRPGHALGAARAGDDAEVDLRLAEPRRVGGDDEVAHHRQLAAAAEREARDRGDHRLPDPQHRLPARGDEIVEEHVGIVALAHLLDVGAGGERLLRPGQHDRADRRVGVEGEQLVAEFAHELIAQRVQRLRAVEPDQADPAVRLDEDHLRHVRSQSSLAASYRANRL